MISIITAQYMSNLCQKLNYNEPRLEINPKPNNVLPKSVDVQLCSLEVIFKHNLYGLTEWQERRNKHKVMEASDCIIKRENLRNFKSTRESKANTTRILANDGIPPHINDNSWRYYVCTENGKVPVDDYFLRRSTLPFQSLNSEVTQISNISHEDPNESVKADPFQAKTLGATSTGLQEKITKALEDFNGSIHGIVPLVSIDENRQSIGLGTDIAAGVFHYCTKMAQRKGKNLTCSNLGCPDEEKRQNCKFGQTFTVNDQSLIDAVSNKYKTIFDGMFSKTESGPIFCSTPAVAKTQTTTKKSRNTAKMAEGSIHYQESHTQVLSSIQNRVLVGRMTRRDATFVTKNQLDKTTHPAKLKYDGSQELKHLQSVPQVSINIVNPVAISSEGLKKNSVATVACAPTENTSAIFVNHINPDSIPRKMSFQVSGTVTWS